MAGKTENELEVLWGDIKSSPAIAIVLVLVVAAIIYYVYRKNNSGTTAATTSSTSTNTNPQSPYVLINDIITPPAGVGSAGPAGPQGPAGAPGTPGQTINSLMGKTRPKTNADQSAAGVGVYTAPGGTISRYQPFDSAVTVTGTTTNVSGVDYYPVSGGGYIRERDLVGFG